ncbi:hypothetical protein RAS12_00815 [Achromobacter seleniivolatilans]|uniref:VanZ-like domain-containing protein n=1 Tax=Achromobacter seleniivolatilans TaxID=3047478 RepID=A0ABY9M1R7_9BURK|nr:hypothetical protein [Achromobacter sp. R39]WMD20946.1 hypothetical protein RAS12_00815 [Achromobacter sp. R39]
MSRHFQEFFLLAHLIEQMLEPLLWGMVAFTLAMLRVAPLQGWRAVIVAGISAGMVFDTIQFRVGPPRLWDTLVVESIVAALLAGAVLETAFHLFQRLRAARRA